MDKRYDSNNLSRQEMPLKQDFEYLKREFGNDYDIFVRNEDFARTLAAGIVERESEVPRAITIYLKYGSLLVDNPLRADVIKRARTHLESSRPGDLILNRPVGAN